MASRKPELSTSRAQNYFLSSHILYRCDLQQASSVTIHLGVLAEAVSSEWHLFGMAVRVHLEPSELDAIAPVWRSRLQRPFDYFEAEFDRAWKSAKPGSCIDLLAADYGSSLLVQPPGVMELPPALARAPTSDTAELRGQVLTSIDSEAGRFLTEPPAVTVRGPAWPRASGGGSRSSATAAYA